MADDTSVQAPARGWRLDVLAGFVGFTLTFAASHFLLPVRLWESSASESTVTLFLSAVVATLTDRQLRDGRFRRRGRAECCDRRDSQNVTSASDGAKIVVSALGDVSRAATETRHSAESVLTASQAVKVAAGALRKEVEGFLSRVAA